jgi:hypothetical protein
MAKASLILRVIYAACLIGAMYVHLDLHFRSGVVLGDLATFGYPLFSRLYWSALTLLDPLAAVMLFVRPRAGLLLAAAIIVSNVTHNSWILYWMNQTADLRYWCQVSFGIFLLMTYRAAWRGAKETSARA